MKECVFITVKGFCEYHIRYFPERFHSNLVSSFGVYIFDVCMPLHDEYPNVSYFITCWA